MHYPDYIRTYGETLNSISLEPHTVTEEQRLVIQRFHSLGHFGMKNVLRDLKPQDYNWQCMLEDLRELLQSCDVGQKWTLAARYFHEMRPNQADRPWNHIQFD